MYIVMSQINKRSTANIHLSTLIIGKKNSKHFANNKRLRGTSSLLNFICSHYGTVDYYISI